jgi:hypothetical protein
MPTPMLRLLILVSLLAGCATLPKDDPRMLAFNECEHETALFGLIPDFGITHELQLFACMERSGWIQSPKWNSRAVDRYVPR